MTDAVDYPALFLKRGEDARLRAGHLWVFSNEIDVKRSPLSSFQPGELCAIVEAGGKPIGIGYVNPNSLIAARLVARGLDHAVDRSLIVHRLNVALGLRERLYAEPYYRLVFGESDGLPGLTLDRFGDVIVGQTTTAGMERLKDEISEAVVKVLKPTAIVWKNDAGIRTLENLPEYADIGYGALASPVLVREGGLEFECDPIGGQKTGWFYDQHANRDRLAPYVAGKRVLDVCSYLGGWGLRAAAQGASEVVCVDTSGTAVEAIRRNIERNGYGDKVTAVKADAFDELKRLREERQRFDVVILDPPAFVKRSLEGVRGQRALSVGSVPAAAGKRVLDVCSYLGGWGLRAAAQGASEVVCVDTSGTAVEAIRRNIERNGYGDKVTAVKADAFDELKRLREERQRFDVVILDPPAFVKRKKDFAEGRIAYRRLNEMAMQILAREGILITCSCSYHMPRAALLDSVQQAARHIDRQVQVLEQLQQSPDHPVHPAIAETDYLKGYICRVLPA